MLLVAPNPPASQGAGVRLLLAVIVGMVAALYTLGVGFGGISQGRRIDGINPLILRAATVFEILWLKPELVELLKRFNLARCEPPLETAYE
jgi:hypothetical protein